MQKIKKLILTGGIFSSSLFFNPGYSQEKEYYVGDPTYSEKEIKKVDKETFWKIAKDNNHYRSGMEDEVNKSKLTKWYVVPGDDKQGGFRSSGPTPKTTQSYKSGSYQATPNSQVKFKSSTTKTTSQTTQSQNSTNNYNPKKTYTPPQNKTNSDLNKVLNTTNTALNVANLGLNIANLIQNRQKQKNIIYNSPTYNSSPTSTPPTPANYNSNPEENKKAFDEWLNGKEETENKNWWSDESNEAKKTENKKTFDEWLNGKELEELLKEQEQKKAEAKLRSEKVSRELSDFAEKQARTSSETKIWFDKEYQEAEEFYKENCKVYLSSCEGLEKVDKLNLIIGYNAYKLGKKTPAGKVMESMETYEDIKEKGMENFWKEEVKEADEFLKKYEANNSKLKIISDEKNLEEKLGTDVYVPKIEKDKYSEQINKIAYESDVAKVIRYRAAQYLINNTEAGDVFEGIEKVDEMKKNNAGWWDE